MSKQSGYVLTIKAFIPMPSDDFEKQALAAAAMGTLTKDKAIPDNFAELGGEILEVKHKFGKRPGDDETE